jgi:hypothetical protein
MSDEERMERGERARQILANPEYERAFRDLEATYVAEMRKGRTVEDREKAHAKLVVLEDVSIQLKRTMDDGQVAAHRVERAKKGIRPV